MIVSTTFILLKTVVFFLLPGLALTRRLIGGKKDLLDWLGWSMTLGFFSVAALAWTSAALSLQRMTPVWLAGCAAATLFFMRKDRRAWMEGFRPALRASAPGWRAAASLCVMAAVFFFLLVKYNRDYFGYTCLHMSAANAVGLEVGSFPELPPILFYTANEREGATAAVAAFFGAYGFFGERLGFAASIVGAGLMLFLLARRLYGSHVLAMAAFLMTALNGMVLMHSFMVNNLIALWASSLLLALLLWPEKTSRLWQGLATGFLLGVRHIFVVAAPAVGLFVFFKDRDGRWKNLRRWAWGTFLLCLPWLVRHTMAYSNPLAFESFTEYGAHEHRFLWKTFHLEGMLNYPFVDRLVRTPYNPAAMWVLLPAAFSGAFGCALLGAVGPGILSLRRNPARLALIAGWVAALFLLLAVQENWMQIEKMAIALIFAAPLIWLMTEGLRWTFGRGFSPARYAAFGAFAMAAWLGMQALTKAPSVPDERFYAEYPNLRKEREEYLQYERDRRLWTGLLPDYRFALRELKPVGKRIRDLAEDLTHPAFEDRRVSPREKMMKANIEAVYDMALVQKRNGGWNFAGPLPEAGAKWVAVDLSRPLMGRNDFLEFADPPRVPRLEPEGGIAAAHNIEVPWSEQPLSLSLFREADGPAYLQLFFPTRNFFTPDPKNLLQTIMDRLKPGQFEDESPPLPEPPERKETRAPYGKVYFQVDPEAPLMVVETLYMDPSRMYRWRVEFEADGPRVEDPIYWPHN